MTMGETPIVGAWMIILRELVNCAMAVLNGLAHAADVCVLLSEVMDLGWKGVACEDRAHALMRRRSILNSAMRLQLLENHVLVLVANHAGRLLFSCRERQRGNKRVAMTRVS